MNRRPVRQRRAAYADIRQLLAATEAAGTRILK
jgi:hypothetical protein